MRGVMAGVFQLILFVWFFGCITTYKVKNRILVEGMGFRSAEFVMLCLFCIGLIWNYSLPNVGKWILFAVLMLWTVIQFFCHWYYTIFGAGKQKIAGYNECFQNTVRIFPMSDSHLIPDFYHIVLHILLLVNLILCAIA